MTVRNESVRLTLEDAGFTVGMAKATARAEMLKQQLNDLDGTNIGAATGLKNTSREVDNLGSSMQRNQAKTKAYTLEMATAEERSNRLRKSLRDQARAALDLESGIDRSGNAFTRNEAKIDKFSGRVGIALHALALLGPGLVPIAAIGIPAVAGLASELGILTLGAGAAVLAFQGVGDALKALNEAQLDPSAANLEKLQEAMDLLAPAAQEFVIQLQAMRPAFAAVRDAGAEALFPHLTESLDDLSTVLPKAEGLMSAFGDAIGEVGEMTAESLASGKWDAFISFLEREAKPTLTTLASSVGSLAHGLSELWMAFDPLNDDFAGWLRDAARGFDDWAAGLSETQGFQDFVKYIRETGPQVADTFSAIANAVLQIAEAAAPLGGPVLDALEGIARVVARVADSNIGTPLLIALSTFSALNTASALWGKTLEASAKRAESGIGRLTNVLGKALAATLALEVAGQVLDAIESKAAGAAPNVERLTAAMIKAGDSGFEEAFGGDLKDVLADIDSQGITDLGAALDDLGESAGGVGNAITTGLATMVGLGPTMTAAGVESEKLAQAMDALDQALVGIAADGGIDMATAELEGLIKTQGLTADQTKILMSALPGYTEALAAAGNESAILGKANWALAVASSPLGGLFKSTAAGAEDAADGYHHAATAAEEFQSALSALSGFLDQKEALLAYQRGVTQLSQSLRNGFTRADRDNLYSLGRTIESVATSIKGAGKRQEFLQGALGNLRAMAADAGPKAKAAIEELITFVRRLGKEKAEPKINVETKAAEDALARVRADIAAVDDMSATANIYVNTFKTITEKFFPSSESAYGNIFHSFAAGGFERHTPEFAGPGPTRVWREPETGGESYIPHANDGRRPRAKSILEQTAGMFGGQVLWFAQGGLTGQPLPNPLNAGVEGALGLAQLLAEIRALKNMLDRDGKNKLGDHDRKIAEMQLKILERQAEVAQLLHDFSLDSILPGGDKPQTLADQAQEQIKALKDAIIDAGGHWTKGMTRWAKGLVAAVSQLDDEIAARDKLTTELEKQQGILDDLSQTMAAFSQQVASNFQPSLFNQGGSNASGGFGGSGGSGGSGGGAQAGIVPVDPALAAALAELAAIQANADGSIEAAAAASKLIAKIAELQAAQEAAQTQADEIAEKYKFVTNSQIAATAASTSGLQALTQALTANVAAANAFAAALATLTANGLDGGLFQQLAQSGDLATAQELAQLSPAEIESLEQLFAASQNAAAAVAAQATQTAFGPAFEAQTKAVNDLNAQLATQNTTITQLTHHIKNMDDKIETGFTPGVNTLKTAIDGVEVAVDRLPNKLQVLLGNHKP